MVRDSGGSTIDKLVEQGMDLLEAGDLVGAREILSQVVVLDPRNEKAWLWRAGAVETDEERRRCLNRVLAINPHNTVAQRGLKRLQPDCPPPEPVSDPLPLNGASRLPKLKRLSIQADQANPAEVEPPANSSEQTSQPRLRRLSVQGPRLDPTKQAKADTSEQFSSDPGVPSPKTYSREMLYWPESPRSKKPIWLALLVGIVIVAFGTYALLYSMNLVGALVVLPTLMSALAAW